jgi:hypothetical protein
MSDPHVTEQPKALPAVACSDLLAAIRDAATGRAEYLRGKAERFNDGPENYKQLMAREKIMIDLAEVMAGAIRRLTANEKSSNVPPKT